MLAWSIQVLEHSGNVLNVRMYRPKKLNFEKILSMKLRIIVCYAEIERSLFEIEASLFDWLEIDTLYLK